MGMKRLHKGETFEVLPEANGMVFAFPKAQKEEIPEEKPFRKKAEKEQKTEPAEPKTTVYYRYYNYITAKSEVVKWDIFQLVKYGANYSKIVSKLSNYVLARSVLLPDGKVFTVEEDGKALLFDANGDVVWTGTMKYKNKAPYSVVLSSNGLWGSFPELDALVRFNPTTMRSELRLGKKGDLFNAPRGLYAEDKFLFVASSGGNKIIKVDTETFETEDIYGFNEPVFSYKKTKIGEVVLLSSGLYEITGSK